jgi:hypothetical protein
VHWRGRFKGLTAQDAPAVGIQGAPVDVAGRGNPPSNTEAANTGEKPIEFGGTITGCMISLSYNKLSLRGVLNLTLNVAVSPLDRYNGKATAVFLAKLFGKTMLNFCSGISTGA